MANPKRHDLDPAEGMQARSEAGVSSFAAQRAELAASILALPEDDAGPPGPPLPAGVAPTLPALSEAEALAFLEAALAPGTQAGAALALAVGPEAPAALPQAAAGLASALASHGGAAASRADPAGALAPALQARAAAALATGQAAEAAVLLAPLIASEAARGLLGLAICAARLGRHAEAVALAGDSLKASTEHPRASMVAGLAEIERGNRRAAQGHLATAARIARRQPRFREDLRTAQRLLLLMHLG